MLFQTVANLQKDFPVYLLETNFMYEWVHTVQIHVVQGSAAFFSSMGLRNIRKKRERKGGRSAFQMI